MTLTRSFTFATYVVYAEIGQMREGTGARFMRMARR